MSLYILIYINKYPKRYLIVFFEILMPESRAQA